MSSRPQCSGLRAGCAWCRHRLRPARRKARPAWPRRLSRSRAIARRLAARSRRPTRSMWRRTPPSHRDYLVFVHVLDDQGERLWGDDHPPAVPTSKWRPGQKVEYTRTSIRAELPVHRSGARPNRALFAVRPARGCRSAEPTSRAGSTRSRSSRSSRSRRTSSSYIRMGGIRPRCPPRTRRTSGSGPRRPPPSRSGTQRRTRRSTWNSTPGSIRSATPQQVTVRSGDQVIGTFAADAKEPKLVDLPVACRPVGFGRHGGTDARGRPDIRARGWRRPGSGDPSLPRFHRAEVGPGRRLAAIGPFAAKTTQAVVILDTDPLRVVAMSSSQ